MLREIIESVKNEGMDSIGVLDKLKNFPVYLLSLKNKDIDKGTITYNKDNGIDTFENQPIGKRYQFMVSYSKKNDAIIVGARPTDAVGYPIELFRIKGSEDDLEKVASKYKTIKAIQKVIKDNIKNAHFSK
jgi:hypothetical protein